MEKLLNSDGGGYRGAHIACGTRGADLRRAGHTDRSLGETGARIRDVRQGRTSASRGAQTVQRLDGTGVPMVPRETQGRRGKEENGKAKTCEAKIGCVFTQTSLDEEGYPTRDEGSRPMSAPSSQPRPSAGAFIPRRFDEVLGRLRRSLSWETEHLGSGELWRCTSPSPRRLWTSIMPESIWPIWAKPSIGLPAPGPNYGQRPARNDSTAVR